MDIGKSACLAVFTITIATAVSAQNIDFGDGMAPFTPSQLLENEDGRFDHWNGIGRMESRGNSMCTAVLIDPRANPRIDSPDVPAYVLSSGHCTYTKSGQLGVDLEIEGHVEFNYFKGMSRNRKSYALKRIKWSSLRGTDLALLELDTTLSRLLKDGIKPLALAQTMPSVGMDVLSVSAPLTATGYTLRLSACKLESVVNIVENPYSWNANLSNRCEDVLPGSSGSPLVNRYTNRIIGIMGTTTRGATEQSRCFTDSPCEVNDGQASWHADTNYASPVDALPACFADGVFDMTGPACTLQSVAQLTLANPDYRKHYIRLERDKNGEIIAPRWNMAFTVNTSMFKFKATRNPADCREAGGYKSSRDARTAHINAVIGTEPGIYSLCIAGHNGNQGSAPGVRENAFIHTVELVEATETPAPNVNISLLDNGKHHITFITGLPTHASHAYKFGAPELTDCADPSGYKTVYYNFNISPKLLPVKLCTLARDEAGHPSPPRTDLLTEQALES
ncbi:MULTISPECIES: trypsin-like serine peptidase [Pseudomonas syringae group]|uniref:Trypsin domain protein n=1 Tax=Pseudomonas syringae pv. ribicola TaxID=55398 RepID=A0A3M2W3I5_PSESI|nr:trypsin-like peptidase domain-containing protein [Pseudomonas syringae group genomosp. 3]RML46084.1 Trypsin domain protein [Pseudomonas syringae pv. ribicola]